MLQWYPHLYVGRQAAKKQGQLIHEIEEKQPFSGAYILTFPLNEANQLEIVPVKSLMREVVYDRTPMIIGLAANKREAYDLLDIIVKDTYAARHDADMKAYLRSRIGETG